jgi:putative endonuclease
MSPVKAKMYYVYILRSQKTGKFYTGCTENLRARFVQHENGRVSSTKNRGPYELVYYEACTNALDAYAREKYLKTGMGKRFMKNRIKRALALTG